MRERKTQRKHYIDGWQHISDDCYQIWTWLYKWFFRLLPFSTTCCGFYFTLTLASSCTRTNKHLINIHTDHTHTRTIIKNTQTNSKTRITREILMWWRVTLLNFPKKPKCALFSIKCTLPFLPPRNVNFYFFKKIRWISIKGQSSTAHAHQCLVQDTRPLRAIACVSAWVCRACPRGRLLARSRTQVEFVIIIFDRHLGRRACARSALPDEPLLRAHMLAVSGMRLMAGDRLRV